MVNMGPDLIYSQRERVRHSPASHNPGERPWHRAASPREGKDSTKHDCPSLQHLASLLIPQHATASPRISFGKHRRKFISLSRQMAKIFHCLSPCLYPALHCCIEVAQRIWQLKPAQHFCTVRLPSLERLATQLFFLYISCQLTCN